MSAAEASAFTPRKEFIREPQRTPNSFALLAFSGSSCIRLYSFPLQLIVSLRRILDQRQLIVAFREDVTQNFSEFTLDGKPWSSPKSVNTEKFIVDIFAVIYQHGYAFLSSIDYGRESDDRLALTFSRPNPSQASRPGSPQSPGFGAAASGSSVSHLPTERRVPFALSFPAATTLRVINPPLHSTPAILQAVRGSWPRGVVSEKKIGEASYEFKLKGYKWFQEDTFATDSLRHILSLLSSLDTHAFSLLTSISLSNRSRVKDLWIFTGPGPASSDSIDAFLPDSPAPSSNNSGTNLPARRTPPGGSDPPRYTQAQQDRVYAPTSQHRRLASAPGGVHTIPQQVPPHQQPPHGPYPPHAHVHARAATESPLRSDPPSPHPQGGLLRKPAPRAQVPVSVVDEETIVDQARDAEGYRVTLPSTVGSLDNMTGVGARRHGGMDEYQQDIIYTAAPDGTLDEGGGYRAPGPGPASPPFTPIPTPGVSYAARSRSPSPPTRGGSPLRPFTPNTPPIQALDHISQPYRSSPPHSSGPNSQPTTPAAFTTRSDSSGHMPPHLLGPGVFATDEFRDSAFSSTTSGSREIPIQWTGDMGAVLHEGDEDAEKAREQQGAESKQEEAPDPRRASSGPMLPGAWALTPSEEKPDAIDRQNEIDITASPKMTHEGVEDGKPRDLEARVASPELVEPGTGVRQSEAGLIGVMASAPEAARPPGPEHAKNGSGQGWVLVNVEGREAPSGGQAPTSADGSPDKAPSTPLRETHHNRSPSAHRSNSSGISPAAKAIAIQDAIDARERAKGGKQPSNKSSPKPVKRNSGLVSPTPASPTAGGSGGLKRLLSLSRSKKPPSDSTDSTSLLSTASTDAADTTESSAKDKSKGGGKARSGFRDRLRKLGTQETKILEDKRMSVD